MTYRFDDFLLNPATRELHRNGVPVVLPARAFDCLAYLIEHRERAVGRDELIAAVWGRVEISDALLGHTIVKIRRSLGDSGNEQRGVRTVPRFGYRWVQPVQVIDEAPMDAVATVEEAADAQAVAPSPSVAQAVSAEAVVAPRGRTRHAVAAAVVVACALAALAFWRIDRHAPSAPAPSTGTIEAAPLAAAVLVLPALVDAPEDWHWLRLGAMDLVANRLRSAAIATTPSESVVGLLRQRGATGEDDLLHDATLAQLAAMRVQPSIRREQGRWSVRLDAFGAQRALSVDAEADDAISAARAAADALLRKLGQASAQTQGEAVAGLDELLQRSGAAMLADQLDQARALIVAAPPLLQQQPRVEQRMAQIELRRGEYEAAESRLHALLDSTAVANDDALRARSMMTLAAAWVRTQQGDRALELYDEAIALRERAADHEVLGVARLGRGSILALQERYDDATAELARARIELATVGDSLGVASVDVNLGEFQRMRHRPADALVLLKKAVGEFELLGAREGRAYALAQQATAERELLDGEAALATSTRFWPADAHTSNQRMRWNLTFERAAGLVASGGVAEGERLIERIGAESDPRKDALPRAQAALLAATIAGRRGDRVRALMDLERALVPIQRDGDPIGWTHGLVLKAALERGQQQLADAAATTATLQAWASASSDEWRGLHAALAAAGQAEVEHRREPALEQYARAMAMAERIGVPEELVEVGAPYLAALVDASQLDTARAVSGRIALWAEHDPRAATAQAHLFRALGQDDAARSAEQQAARLLAAYATAQAGPP